MPEEADATFSVGELCSEVAKPFEALDDEYRSKAGADGKLSVADSANYGREMVDAIKDTIRAFVAFAGASPDGDPQAIKTYLDQFTAPDDGTTGQIVASELDGPLYGQFLISSLFRANLLVGEAFDNGQMTADDEPAAIKRYRTFVEAVAAASSCGHEHGGSEAGSLFLVPEVEWNDPVLLGAGGNLMNLGSNLGSSANGLLIALHDLGDGIESDTWWFGAGNIPESVDCSAITEGSDPSAQARIISTRNGVTVILWRRDDSDEESEFADYFNEIRQWYWSSSYADEGSTPVKLAEGLDLQASMADVANAFDGDESAVEDTWGPGYAAFTIGTGTFPDGPELLFHDGRLEQVTHTTSSVDTDYCDWIGE